jgi:flagellar biosynthesis anti-sigma factor FlgM
MKSVTGNPALDAYHRMTVAGVGAARPAPAVEQGVQRGTSPAAEVNISSHARELALDASSSVDTAKVERLRESIQDGSFKVDDKAVAKGMLEEAG